MKIINLTPHAITEVTTGKVFPASGAVARVSSNSFPMGEIGGCPLFETEFSDVTGLPDPVDGTYYLVSSIVLDASARPDLIAPGELVRDDKGNPIGCKGFRCKPIAIKSEIPLNPYDVMGIVRGSKEVLAQIQIL